MAQQLPSMNHLFELCCRRLLALFGQLNLAPRIPIKFDSSLRQLGAMADSGRWFQLVKLDESQRQRLGSPGALSGQKHSGARAEAPAEGDGQSRLQKRLVASFIMFLTELRPAIVTM